MKLGSTDISKVYLGSTEVSKAYLGNVQVHGGVAPLPYDAEVEYLEGTGVQYIDTGIIPLITDWVYCEYYLVSPLDSADGSATMFGVMDGWATNSFAIVGSPSKSKNNLYFLRGNTSAYKTVTMANFTNSWLSFTINSNSASVMNQTITNNGTGTCSYSAYLFAARNADHVYGTGSTKRIRKFQWKRNGNLILDLKSVRVGQVGYMYDNVSGNLFGNADENSFSFGNDVTT